MTDSSCIPVVAIDGPSGSGKGTIARRVANELGWHLLDSGALYRLVAFAAEERSLAVDNEDALAGVAAALDVRFGSDADGDEQIWLENRDVTSEIRTEDCGIGASAVAELQAVRDALLGLQRGFRQPPGLVAAGFVGLGPVRHAVADRGAGTQGPVRVGEMRPR